MAAGVVPPAEAVATARGEQGGGRRAVRKAVLPAAGHGTRLQPLTRFIPKEMLPVGDRLVLHHVLAEVRSAGIDCLLAVVSREKGALVDAMETITAEEAGEGLYPQVYYVYQRVQGGLGHAVMHAEEFAGDEPIAVALADTIIRPAGRPSTGGASLLARLAEAHLAHGAAATVAVEEVPTERLSRYGVVRPEAARAGRQRTAVFDEPFRILDLVEKPAPAEAPSNLAISARYIFSPEIFPALRATQRGASGEFQLTDAIAALARAGRPVLGLRLAPGERRLDIGNLDSYREAFELLAHGTQP
jgi:UTP--glucose-1-phosphate uridylyltransferase